MTNLANRGAALCGFHVYISEYIGAHEGTDSVVFLHFLTRVLRGSASPALLWSLTHKEHCVEISYVLLDLLGKERVLCCPCKRFTKRNMLITADLYRQQIKLWHTLSMLEPRTGVYLYDI